MVFGWGKKKSENLEIQTTVNKEIKRSEIKKALDDIEELRKKTIVSEVNIFLKNINPQLEELLKIAKQLEHDNLKSDDFDKHLKVIVARGKSQVISVIKSEAKKRLSSVKTFDEVLAVNDEFSQIIKKIGDTLGRQSRVIHIFAKRYALKLKNILAKLNSEKDEIQHILDNYYTLQAGISEISDKLNAIDESKNILKKNNDKISNLNDSITDVNSQIDSIEKDISALKSSSEYSDYLKTQDDISNLSKEENQIKAELESQFTKISRPLNKYSYISSLDREQKILMNQLIDNPIKVITIENKSNIITILSSVRRGVEAGSVSVKDIQKSLQQIDETISLLDGFIKKISEYSTKKKSFEDKLGIFDTDKLKQKDLQLTKVNDDKKDHEYRIKNLEKDIKELEDKPAKLIEEIEKTIRDVSSTRYTVTLD